MITVAIGLATGARGDSALVRRLARGPGPGEVRRARGTMTGGARTVRSSWRGPWGPTGSSARDRRADRDRRSPRRARRPARRSAGQHQSLRLLGPRPRPPSSTGWRAPRIWSRRRLPSAARRSGGARPPSPAPARRRSASGNGRWTCWPTRSARSRRSIPQGSTRANGCRLEEARLAHVERLLERADEAGATLSCEGSIDDAVAGAANALTDAARLDPRAEALAERARGLSAETRRAGARRSGLPRRARRGSRSAPGDPRTDSPS